MSDLGLRLRLSTKSKQTCGFTNLRTCIESADIISPLNFVAKSMDRRLLPTPVGPKTKITGPSVKVEFILAKLRVASRSMMCH